MMMHGLANFKFIQLHFRPFNGEFYEDV